MHLQGFESFRANPQRRGRQFSLRKFPKKSNEAKRFISGETLSPPPPRPVPQTGPGRYSFLLNVLQCDIISEAHDLKKAIFLLKTKSSDDTRLINDKKDFSLSFFNRRKWLLLGDSEQNCAWWTVRRSDDDSVLRARLAGPDKKTL